MNATRGREIVLVDCPDEVGLIHRITGVLQARRLNIESNHEFVDASAGHFFFRAEVTPAGEPVTADHLQADLAAVLSREARVRVTREDRRPIVVCATREPHCLGELLLLDAVGELPGRIVAVVANHNELRTLVERFGVPFHHVSHAGLSREAHEATLLEAIAGYAPDYLVLARYMRVLSAAVIAHYPDRIINTRSRRNGWPRPAATWRNSCSPEPCDWYWKSGSFSTDRARSSSSDRRARLVRLHRAIAHGWS